MTKAAMHAEPMPTNIQAADDWCLAADTFWVVVEASTWKTDNIWVNQDPTGATGVPLQLLQTLQSIVVYPCHKLVQLGAVVFLPPITQHRGEVVPMKSTVVHPVNVKSKIDPVGL